MKAALIHTYGGPDVVAIGRTSAPQPQPQEALVSVEAASVNPLDLKILAGYMKEVFPIDLPYVPGTDFSGTVEAVGSEVTHLRTGDRVVGRTAPTRGGAFAERVTLPAADLCPIAPNMSFEQSAALPSAFGTAQHALFDVGRLRRGQRVLIHAGAGGVGSFAIQLARHAHAHVIATASDSNLDFIKSLGAHEALDYRGQGFSHLRDIDLVLDTIGGETLTRSWSVLRPGGRIATLIDFAIQPRGDQSGEFVFFRSATPALTQAMDLFHSNRLQIVTDSILPFDETRGALEKVATGHSRGKVIIRLRA